jgi:cation/acetate symporter
MGEPTPPETRPKEVRMSVLQRTRLVNPRLGTYFGIFLAAFLALGLLALIFEQLGLQADALRWGLLIGPLALYGVIGISSWTQDPLDFFAAGRRVPAFFTGLGLAVGALGGTGLVALTGLFFLNGFDAWCIANGLTAGLVVMAILIAPYFRKIGTFSVPGYLGRRFENRSVRVIGAALLAVPVLLVIMAEIRVLLFAAGWLIAPPQVGAEGELLSSSMTGPLGLLVAAVLTAITIMGGMRAVGWSGTAAAIAALVALLVPSVIVATMTTNLPLPQFSHGPTLREIGRLEALAGLPIRQLPAFAFELAGNNFETLARRSTRPFGSVGIVSYILMGLTLMAGVAASPWLLPRVNLTPSVYDTRKSFSWALVVMGVLLLTTAGAAVFMRDIALTQLVDKAPAELPGWFRTLISAGAASFDATAIRLQPGSIAFKRDIILAALPIAAGLPATFTYLALVSIIAATIVGATTAIQALATIIAEDGINGLRWEPLPARPRLLVARACLGAVAVTGTWLAALIPADPLTLLLWAFALSGSTAFPVLFLSIWWKRINSLGALVGMVVGFAVAVLAILAGQSSWFGVHSAMAGIFAIPASFAAAIITASVTSRPGRHVLETVRDMRVPGGETLYDREQRLARLKQRQQAPN